MYGHSSEIASLLDRRTEHYEGIQSKSNFRASSLQLHIRVVPMSRNITTTTSRHPSLRLFSRIPSRVAAARCIASATTRRRARRWCDGTSLLALRKQTRRASFHTSAKTSKFCPQNGAQSHKFIDQVVHVPN